MMTGEQDDESKYNFNDLNYPGAIPEALKVRKKNLMYTWKKNLFAHEKKCGVYVHNHTSFITSFFLTKTNL